MTLPSLACLLLLPLVQDPTAVDLPGFTPRSQTVRGPDGDDLAAVRRERAVWPIANGRVFAYAGYGEAASRLFMITGPQYQTRRNHEPHGAFGSTWIEVVRDDEQLAPVERTWKEVARAAAVRTREVVRGGHELTTLDFALADAPVIVRRVRLRRTAGDDARVSLRLRMDERPDGAAQLDGLALRKEYQKGGETFRLVMFALSSDDVMVRGHDGMLLVEPQHDGEVAFDVVLATSRGLGDERTVLRAIDAQGIDAHLSDALGAWRRELSGTITAWPDGPIRQHLEAVKKLVLAQRSRPGGGVAPMVSFKGVWARDANGPLKAFLWMGRGDLARSLLRYYRMASASHGSTWREYRLDLDVEDAPPLDSNDWEATGTDRCEVPSWIVLQHAWYWHATGDAELVRTAYPYVHRNATHQESFDSGTYGGPGGPLQRFNGDETYLHGAFYALFPQRNTWPNEFPRVSAWSLDSLLTWEAALRAMPTLGRVAGEEPARIAEFEHLADTVRALIEASFWLEAEQRYAPALSPVDLSPHRAPYAPINLRPLWLGTHTADDPRAVANLTATIALLGREDGLCRSTPSVEHFIGTLPGYWLANLAALDHPLAWRVLPAVLATSSAEGAWSEVHVPSGGPGHGYDATWPNRYRPWESGLVMDAVLRFLTGAEFEAGRAVRLRPRRPAGLQLERLGPLAVGASRLMLHYPTDAGSDTVRVALVGGPSCRVNGEVISLGEDVRIPLAKPVVERAMPAPRAFDGRIFLPAGERLIVTTLREPAPAEGDVFLDAGLPFEPEHLAAVFFESGGARRYDAVVIEPWARRADRETMKPTAFWTAPVLTRAFARFEAAGGRIDRPDLVSEWWICGPFPNPGSRGLFLEARPLEAPFDAEARFAVDGQSVDARWWRRMTGDGRLDLHPPEGPQDDVCVFARTVIPSDEARDATLLLGSDDGCRVWLGGELVFESIAHRHLTPDEFRVPIRLQQGENVLVIGVEDRFGGFGLAARIR